MNFLHAREQLLEGDIVVVDCSHQCNIMIMDDSNFNRYKSGKDFRCHGGHYTMLPARIEAPYSGYWNVVLDLAGGSARITHSITIERGGGF